MGDLVRVQCWEVVVRRRHPCTLVAPHLRAPSVPTSPSFQAPSSRLRWASCAPARLAQSRLGFIRLPPARSESGFPFSWTRFLTWALWRGSASRAPGPGSGRRSPVARAPSLTPGTTAPLLQPWPQGLLGQAHNFRLGPPDYFLLLPQIRLEMVSSRKGRARGGGR